MQNGHGEDVPGERCQDVPTVPVLDGSGPGGRGCRQSAIYFTGIFRSLPVPLMALAGVGV